MARPFATAAVAASVLALVLDLLFFQVLLSVPIRAEPALHLPIDGPWPKIIIQAVVGGFALTWLYSKGVTTDPWLGQGLRFGVAIALLTHGAIGLLWAGMLNHQGEHAIVGSIAMGMVRDVVVCLAIAWFYRGAGTARTP